MGYFFARLDEKRNLLGNFEKTLKIFDENSIEHLNFYFILFSIFFGFGGRGIPPFPPGYALDKLLRQATQMDGTALIMSH